MAPHPSHLSILLVLSILTLRPGPSSPDDKAFAKSLLRFKKTLANASPALDTWREPTGSSLCSLDTPNWRGLVCSNGSLVGLRLENMGLAGTIDVSPLIGLPILTLSVMRNNLSGPFPAGLRRLGRLRSLFLADNRFSGEIPGDSFEGMRGMRRVVVGNNFFGGRIPRSLIELPRLVDLQVQGNRFVGRVPDFRQAGLVVNFSNNELGGEIPAGLGKQSASSFLGNINLCGEPLEPCKPNRAYKNKVAFIASAVLIVAVLSFAILFFLHRRRSKPLKYEKSLDRRSQQDEPNGNAWRNDAVSRKSGEHGKMYFVRGGNEMFSLDELMKAPAEMLGSGSFGSSYKTTLFGGRSYVVRRFRQMSDVGKEEFYEHMRRLGRLSHRNLLPIVGFYYRKEEKLLVSDFVGNGSLASHLHGKRTPNQPSLDWPKRLRIIKGVARGLAYLYKELPTLTLPHGHLKSSNVLLDPSYEPLLADYGLSPLINKDHALQFMVAHKSPESTQQDQVTHKTDVWNLGILILELLTGHFPANYLKRGQGPSSDLATWIDSVAREEWSGEVFDKDMMGNSGRNYSEKQMLRLLKIGMCCCEWDVESRWDLREAVQRIEELKKRDGSDDDDNYNCSFNYASEGDFYSPSSVMADDCSISMVPEV